MHVCPLLEQPQLIAFTPFWLVSVGGKFTNCK
jgi:hypothetical protein